MSKKLNGKHALLTGAGGGIGLAVAQAYLREGARCTVADLAAQPSDAFKAATAEYGDAVHYVSADVTKLDSIDALITAAEAKFGGIDVPPCSTWPRCWRATRPASTSSLTSTSRACSS